MAGQEVKLILSALDNTQRAFTSLNGSLTGLTAKVAIVGAKLAAFQYLIGSVKDVLSAVVVPTARTGDELYKMSQKIGISVEALSGLKYAAELSDVSLEELRMGLGQFSQQLQAASQGGKEQTSVFKALGIQYYDNYGKLKPMEELLLDVADRFAKLKDGADKTALAMDLFGRSGANLIPYFNQGSEGIKKLNDEAKRMGLVMSTDAAKGAEEFNDNLTRLNGHIEGFKIKIGNDLIGRINQVFDTLSGRINEAKQELHPFIKSIYEAMGIKLQPGTTLSDLKESSGELKAKNNVRESQMRYEVELKADEKRNKIREEHDRAVVKAIADRQLLQIESLDKDLEKKLNAVEQWVKKQNEQITKKFQVTPISEELKRKWTEVESELKLDISKTGLDEFSQKILVIEAKAKELIKTFKDVPGAEKQIREWEFNLYEEMGDRIRKEEGERAIKQSHDAWDKKTLAKKARREFDEKTRKEQEEHENQQRADREAQINHQLSLIDLAEKEHRISKKDALSERIKLTSELQTIQEEHLATMVKENDTTAWYAQQDAITKTRDRLVELNFELKRQIGQFAEGFKYGLDDYIRNVKTKFDTAADLARTTAQSMESAFSDFFFDSMQGKLKSFSDYFNSFMLSVQRAIAQIMAQQTAQGIVAGVAGLWGPSTGSGAGSGAGSGLLVAHKGGYLVPKFHIGGLADDEIPAILQRGEYVVSKKGVDALNRINRGQGVNPNVNVVVNVENKSSHPVDAQVGSMKIDMDRHVIGIILKDIQGNGPLRGAIQGVK